MQLVEIQCQYCHKFYTASEHSKADQLECCTSCLISKDWCSCGGELLHKIKAGKTIRQCNTCKKEVK